MILAPLATGDAQPSGRKRRTVNGGIHRLREKFELRSVVALSRLSELKRVNIM